MTARELWDSISEGNSVAIISDKQRTFLIDLAKREKLFNVSNTEISFPDGVRVHIRNARTKVGAYGGGLVNKNVSGKFKAEVLYLIEFTDTKLTQYAKDYDMKHFQGQGHKFTILKP